MGRNGGISMIERLRFKVEGMDCASCARKIETAVKRIGGVSDISVNTMTETLSLSADAATAPAIERAVRDLGYPPRLIGPLTLESAPPIWTPDTDADGDE